MRIQPNVSDQANRDVKKSEAVGSLVPTPTDDDLPRRFSDFDTMPEALDYAA